MPQLQVAAWARLRVGEGGIATALTWLPPLPPGFPLPATGSELLLEVGFDSGSGCALRLSSDFQLEGSFALGPFSLGRRVGFEFSANLPGSAVSALFDGTLLALSGELRLVATMRPPMLPALGPLAWRLGGEDGWIDAEFSGSLVAGESLTLAVEFGADDLALDLALPGNDSGAQPLLALRLERLEFELSSAAEAQLSLAGQATLNPALPGDGVPFAHQWRQLLPQHLGPVTLGCTLSLAITADHLALDLSLEGAEIELSPFATFAGLANAVSGVQGEREMPIDLPLRFALRGARLQLGSSLAALRFELLAMLAIGEVDAQVSVGVVGSEFRVSIGQVAIPLALPPCPLTAAQFDEFYEPEDLIDERCRDEPAQRFLLHAFHAVPNAAALAGREMDADAKARYRDWLRLLLHSMELASSRESDAQARAYRITPRVLELLAALPQNVRDKLALISGRIIGTAKFQALLRQRLGQRDFGRHGAEVQRLARIRGASFVGRIVGEEHTLLEDLTLRIDHLEVVLPLASPNNVRAAGQIALGGWSDLLGPIDIALEAGISADMIFLSLKAVDGRIPLPDHGRYRGGGLRFSRFLIGFGYTKRSLALAFEGEVLLPERLVADLDTSPTTVIGVRLPVQSRLVFRLDLVPVPAPEVAIIVPLFQFNLDLRRPGVAALRDAERCLPVWDGLQFIFADRFRCSIEHVAFSPVFGFLPAWNWVLGGDIVIGDEHNGLALAIDEWMQIDAFWTPSSIKIALPGFSDDTPFVNDCCFELRLAGFGVHVHVQRPFPSLSPLALPELFALLSAPDTYPVNPRGELANSLRVSLLNTGIRLPENLLALFPALRGVARPALTETLNLGTFITLAQKIFGIVSPVLAQVVARIRAATQDPRALRRSFRPPTLKPRDLLRLLPASLQRLQTQASFAGFDGRAILLLMPLPEARQALRDRGSGAPVATPLHGLEADGSDAFSAAELLRFPDAVPDSHARPPPSAAELLSDPLFTAFAEADLGHSALAGTASGLLVGARLAVLTGQPVDFIGFVASNGNFALIAASNAPALKLAVVGIDVKLPFEASTRLTLKGQAGPDGASGRLKAQGRASWVLLPKMLEAEIDKAAFEISSDGDFSLKGELRLALFDGRLVGSGDIVVTPNHATVAARFQFDQAPLKLDLRGTGLLGPLHRTPSGSHAGARIDVTALGAGYLYGQRLVDLRVHLTGERLEVQGTWRPKDWQLFATSAVLKGELALTGRIWFPDKAPAMALEGQGQFALQWNPAKATPADVRFEGRLRFESGPESNRLDAAGSLLWQGRRWASATLSAMPHGVALAGHTSFSIELPPRGTPLLPRLPRLVLRLDIGGRFELDGSGLIRRFAFDAHWLVGLRFDDDSDQLFTLAAAGRRFDSDDVALDLTLLRVSNFRLVPGPGLQLPTLRPVGDSIIDIGFTNNAARLPAVHFHVPGFDKSVRMEKAGLTVDLGELGFGSFSIGGADVPRLIDGNDVDLDDNATKAQIFPMAPHIETVTLPWPEDLAPNFSIHLETAGQRLALRLELPGSPSRRFTL